MARRPSRCPECGSRSVARLIHGLHRIDEDLQERLDSGKVALGGCCIEDSDFELRCNDCWHGW